MANLLDKSYFEIAEKLLKNITIDITNISSLVKKVSSLLWLVDKGVDINGYDLIECAALEGDLDNLKKMISRYQNLSGIQRMAAYHGHKHILEWWPYTKDKSVYELPLTQEMKKWLDANGWHS